MDVCSNYEVNDYAIGTYGSELAGDCLNCMHCHHPFEAHEEKKCKDAIRAELMKAPIPGCSNQPDEPIAKHMVHAFGWLFEEVVNARYALEQAKAPKPLAADQHEVGELQRLRKENDIMRRVIAKSDLDCIYCGLPKKDMAMCPDGFPGCGRADDLTI